MKNDAIKIEIERLLKAKDNLWTGFLVTASGSLAMMFSLNSVLKSMLFVLGVIVSVMLFIAYFKKDDEIDKLIKDINKDI